MTTAQLYLELHEAEKLIAAAFNSKAIGHPFTHFLTINFGKLGIAPIHCQPEWQRMLKAIRRLHQRHNLPLIAAWVFERQETGVHVHCLIHLGEWNGKVYDPLLRIAIGAKRPPKGTIKNIRFHSNKSWEQNMRELLFYMCKGIRPENQPRLIGRLKKKGDSEPRPSQGYIVGKRYGFTRNLSPNAKRNNRTP